MSLPFNVEAAEANLMQAIYGYSATWPIPLSSQNCQGLLYLGHNHRYLEFGTNNLASILAPMMFANITISDFGYDLNLDAPEEDGQVAMLGLAFNHQDFDGQKKESTFAHVRFNAAGEILGTTFFGESNRDGADANG